jgi:hypothetical protein
MGILCPFPGGKERPRREANNSHHLAPRSRISRSYTSPIGTCMALAGQINLRLLFILLSNTLNVP